MELWVRSQDRERLIKASTLFVEYNGDVDPTISPYRVVADKCIDLGIYKSKERALEVLDEIQNKINNYASELYACKNIYVGDISYPTYIYEMPKD